MAIKIVSEVYDILTAENQRDYSITALDKDGNDVTIISSDSARHYMKQKYGDRSYPALFGGSATIYDVAENFHETYKLYLLNRWRNINRMYQTLFDYDYSPIENYNRTETENIVGEDSKTYGHTITDTGSDITTYGKTDTLSGTDSRTTSETISVENDKTDAHTGTETKVRTGSEITENEKAGFNAPNTYTKDSKSTIEYDNVQDRTTFNDTHTINDDTDTTRSETESTQYGKRDTLGGSDSIARTNESEHSGTDTGTNETDRDMQAFGNIGVTTNQEMILEELEVRKISLAEMLIDNFINDYTFYS